MTEKTNTAPVSFSEKDQEAVINAGKGARILGSLISQTILKIFDNDNKKKEEEEEEKEEEEEELPLLDSRTVFGLLAVIGMATQEIVNEHEKMFLLETLRQMPDKPDESTFTAIRFDGNTGEIKEMKKNEE